MKDIYTKLINLVPELRKDHKYYSASVAYRAAEFIRDISTIHCPHCGKPIFEDEIKRTEEEE